MTATAAGRLRAATRAWHDALESSDFALALRDGTLPLPRYVGQLAAFRDVWEALETELAELSHATCPEIARVWSPDFVKVPLLDADLRHFTASGAVPAALAAEATHAFADEIRRTSAADPPQLLGFLYVLEGSTLGARSLRPLVRAAYGLGAEGVAYYGSGDRDRWARLTARLDETLTDPALQSRVIAAAERAYRHTALVTRALSAGPGPVTRACPPDI
ncbi:biliverdin-producing heme oxygenase [Streptomyces ferrugineus]|uniref:Biliverdin-producing heme oxygenase n=1 Tax=Streptomyces ferrugineus TaxID=1413221 RepID=A0A7M2SQ56_9ACTN|nr:biliverdin-producing heme oxygenase [Streptomyces ferrugineus]QOV38497.1 biliverdin-producing heme oxygenase [Streptomyces ferrugineus]